MLPSHRQFQAFLQGALAAVFAVGVLLWAEPSLAHGALAISMPTSVTRDGFAYGYANNYATRDAARKKALSECRHAKTPMLRRLCTLVRTYNNECETVAMDPKAGTPGVGWAIAPTLHEAQAQALANCRATAGRSRREACRIDETHCDGHAK